MNNPSQYFCHCDYDVEPAERRRAALRLTLVLFGLAATLGLRQLDDHLSAQQTAHSPRASVYQSDFGSPRQQQQHELAARGDAAQSFTF